MVAPTKKKALRHTDWNVPHPLSEYDIHVNFIRSLGFETIAEKCGLSHRIVPRAFQMIHHRARGNKLGTDFLLKWVGA